ncbi:hypothetical protein DDE18_16885 [Nocardioides gansuensis]|uniref:Uncharacterized protein n=1 Tax=Nocardioides gansuensis TaxID=2138300 RepID=A0A2T8F7H0_9ACTN|nr:hypothetical protein [Nocardioides gansuensis]PVG81664.1 hypothetical protein DDE18_16885 [Nocardioides gansuensis]
MTTVSQGSTTFILDPEPTPELDLGARDLDLLVFDTTHQTADPLVDWLLDGTTRLFEEFRVRLTTSGLARPVSVLFLDAGDDDRAPLVEATFASVQATALSLALEYPRTRITVLRAHRSQLESIQDTADFLSSDASAYVTATTIDLRSAS